MRGRVRDGPGYRQGASQDAPWLIRATAPAPAFAAMNGHGRRCVARMSASDMRGCVRGRPGYRHGASQDAPWLIRATALDPALAGEEPTWAEMGSPHERKRH